MATKHLSYAFGAAYVGIVVGMAINDHHYGEYWYHLSGVGLSFFATAIDLRSTLPVIKMMNTPGFRERQLADRFVERNPLTGTHPTVENFLKRAGYISSAAVLLAAAFPFMGYAHAAAVVVVSKRNHQVCSQLEQVLAEKGQGISNDGS